MFNPFKKKKPKTTLQDSGPEPSETFTKGLTDVKDIIAPAAIEVDFDHLKIGNHYFRTLFVSGYPRFVGANWLAPLINFEHTLDISFFYYPVESKGVLDDLRRKIAEMEATITTDMERGRVVDPVVQAALEDARTLQEQLVKGVERFFQFSFYITISTESLEELNNISKRVEATLGSLMILSKHATLQMEQAFKSTVPTCMDKLLITRNMDTTSLATTFPFTSSELTANEGILYGINEHNGSLVIFDRFTLENANSVFFAKAGAGKSIAGDEVVLIRDKGGEKLEPVKQVVDMLVKEKGATKLEEEIEGVLNPDLEVYTFDKNLQGRWSPVSVAARKKAPKNLYKFATKSGRKIKVTGDHNMLVLRQGRVVATKSGDVKKDECLPIPRIIPAPQNPLERFDLLEILGERKGVYVLGAENLINNHYKKIKVKKIDPRRDKYLYKYRQGRRVPLDYFNKLAASLEVKEELPKALKLGSRNGKKEAALPASLPITTSLVRILGYITSEGTITEDYINISNTDPKVINDIKETAASLQIPCFEIHKGINIGIRVFTELVKALGADGKSAQKRVPPFLFNSSNECAASYLKSYFEGDGTVGKHEVTATSKSEELISDLMYLLLRFGVVARRRTKFKQATNSSHQGDYYHQVVISGQENLKRFALRVGFVTEKKTKKLYQTLGKEGNTNVDTIPTLEPILKQIYQLLFSSTEIPAPPYFSDLKRGKRHPSQKNLGFLVKNIETHIEDLEENLDENLDYLTGLPPLEPLVERGTEDRMLNGALWSELGQSWRMAKNEAVAVGCKNALTITSVVTEEAYNLTEIKRKVKKTFDLMGLSISEYNPSLRAFLIQRPQGDGSYKTLLEAVNYLNKEAEKVKEKIKEAKRLIETLKLHTQSDLFWDPVKRIEKLPCRDDYVYDLTVDNEVFLAGSGGMFVHNSYLVKLEAMRSLMFGTEIMVIDPEGEYKTLCEALGGEYVSFSVNDPARINPFDLSGIYEEGEDELGLKILSLHRLFKVIFGQISNKEEAILDRALILCYKSKGITQDPETQKKEPPLMEDLYKVLLGFEEEEAKGLAERLERYVRGSLAGIFDQHSNVDIKNTFTVFGIRELEDKLRPIAMFIVLDFIWNKIKKDMKKRILVVDEAWYLMQYPDSARFLYSIAKRARKYYLGLTTLTQDVEDFLASDFGKAIVTNSSIQVLFRQHPAAIDQVADVFYLSDGEKRLLLSANIGEGLFFAGPNHVAIQVVASPEEHRLVTTKPSELLAMEEERKAVVAASHTAPPSPPSQPSEPSRPSPPEKGEDEFQQKILKQLEELDEVKKKAKPPTLAERFESENLSRRQTQQTI